MKRVLQPEVRNRCHTLSEMTDQLNTPLSAIGGGPPSKRPKLDSVGDGTGKSIRQILGDKGGGRGSVVRGKVR